jgi:hypothetical protein
MAGSPVLGQGRVAIVAERMASASLRFGGFCAFARCMQAEKAKKISVGGHPGLWSLSVVAHRQLRWQRKSVVFNYEWDVVFLSLGVVQCMLLLKCSSHLFNYYCSYMLVSLIFCCYYATHLKFSFPSF